MALDNLFTRVPATLMHRDLVPVQRISRDGTRIRAGAGTSSFRRKGWIEEFPAKAKTQVEALKQQAEEVPQVSAGG